MIVSLFCKTCGHNTLCTEGSVVELSRSTVWYCLLCGTEIDPPRMDSNPNEPVEPIHPPVSPRDSVCLVQGG